MQRLVLQYIKTFLLSLNLWLKSAYTRPEYIVQACLHLFLAFITDIFRLDYRHFPGELEQPAVESGGEMDCHNRIQTVLISPQLPLCG